MRIAILRIFGILLLSVVFSSANPSYGAQVPQTAKFANCTELNSVYPGGVAKSARVTNKGGETKNTPAVKPSIYKKNASKDRDKDGIACER
jgi:hypothetical protein